MNILGVNPFHNGSICILSNGELVYFLEEERLSRLKQDELPFKTLLKVLSKYKIDYIAIGGLNHKDVISGYRGENIIFSFIKKFIDPTPPCIYLSHHHHLTHISSAFFNSGFEESLGSGTKNDPIITPERSDINLIFAILALDPLVCPTKIIPTEIFPKKSETEKSAKLVVSIFKIVELDEYSDGIKSP